jgi:hypothetical protein
MVYGEDVTQQAFNLDHLYQLTDGTGMYQHALGPMPNPEFGYCLDDNARALIVALRAHALTGDGRLLDCAERYLAFVERAQRPDGRFRNFMDAGGAWLEELGSDDANGRAVWGLGFAARRAPDVRGLRERATAALRRALPGLERHEFLRAKAFSLLGLHHWLAVQPGGAVQAQADALAADLAQAFERSRQAGWEWFEDRLTYCNASLGEALIGSRWEGTGCRALAWLCETLEQGGVLSLIGSDGWYVRGGQRAAFDQQAVDAAAVSSACLAAFRLTGEARFERWRDLAYGWFVGRNVTGERMVDDATGGCFDGLRPSGHNENQGAESLLAWLSVQEDALERTHPDGSRP